VDLQDESGQSNGQVDHLFLFAGNEPPKDLPAGIFEGSFWIDTEDKIADIWPKVAGEPGACIGMRPLRGFLLGHKRVAHWISALNRPTITALAAGR
jgi:hypothetical protein